ncbi:XRE family transcriptional regulator [Streptomyces sp. SID3343]|uniref:telomere-protecting terminal protein Tpg n=1 Tax=Streptomyces sp. SID3343 TaxID=2690260 RepID=UPI00136F08AA|nr:XRE family transcriptional regulator [Streptomyces sp. SID3343]MYW00373.1 XRE family transcriptional regulator [Streptomyces sp. SID3343]
MGKIGDGLDQAAQHVLTRKPPQSTKARVRFLLSKNQGRTRAVAERLGVSQRTVERYLKGDRKHPPRPVNAKIDAEVRRLWQPQVRRRAEQRAAAAGGLVVETRARFGFSSAAGSTDDPRMRRVTQPLAPGHARQLLDAHHAGATEGDLARIVAAGLQEAYFQDGGTRAGDLDAVELTDIDYVEFDIRG